VAIELELAGKIKCVITVNWLSVHMINDKDIYYKRLAVLELESYTRFSTELMA